MTKRGRRWARKQAFLGPIILSIHGGDAQRYLRDVITATQKLLTLDGESRIGVREFHAAYSEISIGMSLLFGMLRHVKQACERKCSVHRWLM
jgi:hypothetical protein